MSPLLSIVTICYEDPEALRSTLRSLSPLANEELSWEHVVVDASPERHREVLAQHPAANRLVHVEEPPRGIYPALNAGLRKASGTFVWFLNAGDQLADANALLTGLGLLAAAPAADMGIAGAALERDGAHLHVQKPRLGPGPLWGINRICHQAVLYRRSLFDRIGPYSEEYKLAGDYEHHLRALARGAVTVELPVTLVRYDRAGRSARADAVLAEFRKVHEALSRKGELPLGWLHRAAWEWERARIGAFAALAGTPAGPWLKRQWHRWKDRS